MTISTLADGVLVGLSTDTKTAMPAGYMFRETDTGDVLMCDGTYWWLTGSPSVRSTRRIGILSPGQSIGNGAIGLCANLTAATSPGGGNNVINFSDVTNGRYYPGISGAVSTNKGGSRQAAIATIRGNNPKMTFKFKLITNTVQNFYLGYIGGGPTEPAGADPFGAGSPGVVFGVNTGLATNWALMHNDTVGATVVDNTGVAYDTNIHTVNLVADDANTRFSWNIDGGAYTHVTTDIPTQINGLGFVAEIEAQEAVAKSFNLYTMSIQADK